MAKQKPDAATQDQGEARPRTDLREFLATLDLSRLIKASGTAAVTHKPGAFRLDDYPLLAYAPSQHGAGVRTEDNGIPVASIVEAVSTNPDIEAVAGKFGTTPDHVADALRYAEAVAKGMGPDPGE